MERITLDAALVMGRDEARELQQRYGTSTLAPLVGLAGLDRLYTRAEGCRLWDDQGRIYLDFAHGGALNLGHNPPQVLEAVRRVEERPDWVQAGLSPVVVALLQNLAAIAPGPLNRTFLTGSGVEAVKVALALARLATERPGIIACGHSIHGTAWGAWPAGEDLPSDQSVQPLAAGWKTVPYGDLEALEAALASRDAAAFLVEPVQMEGGVILPPAGYLKEAEALCRQAGTLLIVDETHTGLGRAGSLLACQAEGVEADILCLGPSLGGGVEPVSATVTTEGIWRRSLGRPELSRIHAATWGGTTRGAAAALAAIETILEDGLAQRAAELGAYLRARLEALQVQHATVLKAVRGRGLVIGLEFQESRGWVPRFSFGGAARLTQESLAGLVAGELLQRHRILTALNVHTPNVLRLEPPMTVTREEIDQVIDGLAQVLAGPRSPLGLAVRSARSALSGLLSRRGGPEP